ncbi:hypothetical protein E4U45_004174 [Claviceps purpurea]|nr:hypothetical protein E4U45_004174 [Claviceps purpurea]
MPIACHSLQYFACMISGGHRAPESVEHIARSPLNISRGVERKAEDEEMKQPQRWEFSPSGSPSASFDTELTVMVMARPIRTATIQTTPDAAREVAGSLEVRMLETFSCNDFRGGGSDGEALV